MKLRKIYAIEFYERDGEGERIVFTKVLPDVPLDYPLALSSRNVLEEFIANSNMSEIDKLCASNGIGFACDRWFPNHFYRIALVDWKG
jgi:hypothetical protein